jgi:Domain of unknown function (DUF4382)
MYKLKNNSKPLIWLMGLLLTAFIAGCGSGGDGGGMSTAQPGTLGVSLTDAPACGFDEVNVTVSKVRVHQSDTANENAAGWADIALNPPKKINLLDLKDALVLKTLGETSLTAGHYTQLRLVLIPNSQNEPLNNSVVPSTTMIEEPLDTPSAIQSGIKLIHQFTVDSGQRVDLLLDFDACKSIVQTGNGKYKLKPVIKVIPFVLNGIEGFVDTNLLGSNVAVSAQNNEGEIIRATVPNTTTGKFFLAHLETTDCPTTCYNVVITADNHATAVIARVPVPTTTIITTVSTSDDAISLGNSATHNISGTVSLKNQPDPQTDPILDAASVLVAAKQTLNSIPTVTPGPIVTVKPQVAALVPGDPIGDYTYDMSRPIKNPIVALPIAAPSLGLFGPLPITLDAVPQSSVAGIYTVKGRAETATETSTTVYATQTPSPSPVNISVDDAINQDFALTTP